MYKQETTMKIEGDLKITKENENDFAELTEVTGSLHVDGSAKLDALTTVGGYLHVSGSAKLDAPKLGEGNDPTAKAHCEAALSASLRLRGLVLIDGILSWLLGEKTIGPITAFEIKIVGKLTTSFVVKRGDDYSHGETIEKAIEDLRFKIGSRDTSEFEAWKSNLDQEVSFEDAVAGYRVVTGACEMGVNGFVQSIQMPEKLTPNVILKLTEGQYGHEQFRSFLTEARNV